MKAIATSHSRSNLIHLLFTGMPMPVSEPQWINFVEYDIMLAGVHKLNYLRLCISTKAGTLVTFISVVLTYVYSKNGTCMYVCRYAGYADHLAIDPLHILHKHWPPETAFGIRALAVWGRERYLSVTEAPHNIESLRTYGEETFCFFENSRSPTFQGGSFNHCTRTSCDCNKLNRFSAFCTVWVAQTCISGPHLPLSIIFNHLIDCHLQKTHRCEIYLLNLLHICHGILCIFPTMFTTGRPRFINTIYSEHCDN